MTTANRLLNALLGRGLERPESLSELFASPAVDPLSTHGVAWLVLLRWVAVGGQLATIIAVRWLLGVELRLAPMLSVVAVTAVSNAALALWSASRRSDGGGGPGGEPADRFTMPILELALVLDLVLLTLLLSFSGGPENPFSVFFFVNLCLSAVVLPRRLAWANFVAAFVCFVSLFFSHRPLPGIWTVLPPVVRSGAIITRAGWGLLVAFTTCSIVIVYFTSLLRDQLRKRERQLQAFEVGRARTQKLEALGTLAAGAAHELANPLATVAVAVREVERRVKGTAAEAAVLKDIALVRSELDHCRNILKRMNRNAGTAMGEPISDVDAAELVEETLDGLQGDERVEVVIDPALDGVTLRVPAVGLAQAMRGLLQNAIIASRPDEVVWFRALRNKENGGVTFVIEDSGVGMDASVLARVGDPFFTTKEPGHGTGLGVFLARAVIERLGGTLSIDSAVGRGTTVTVHLPPPAG